MTETTPSRRAGLRDEIAKAIHRYDNHHALSGNDIPSRHHRGEADAVMALLYREWPWLRAEAEELTEARAVLARVQLLADEYPAGIDTALIHEALDTQAALPARCSCTGTNAGLNACTRCPTPWPDIPGANRIRHDDEPRVQLPAAPAPAVTEQAKAMRILYERWVKAGPPPIGTSMSRWWDARLVELHHAIHPPAPAPTDTQKEN